MMKFDVCLEMVMLNRPYEERIAEAAKAGFNIVEFWFHDATFGTEWPVEQPKDADAIRQACGEHGVTVNNMVVNAPDGSIGGSLVNSADRNKYLERLEETIAFSKSIGCNKAITCSGNLVPGLTREQMRSNIERVLTEAASIAASKDFKLLLEPLNTHVDHAGYYLDSSKEAAEIVRVIGSPNLKLLYDVYHMQIMEGNVISNIQKNIDIIEHFHSAGVPGRHEIMDGELNYREVIKRIEQSGYSGCFGLEYSPAKCDCCESLTATRAYLADLI